MTKAQEARIKELEEGFAIQHALVNVLKDINEKKEQENKELESRRKSAQNNYDVVSSWNARHSNEARLWKEIAENLMKLNSMPPLEGMIQL